MERILTATLGIVLLALPGQAQDHAKIVPEVLVGLPGQAQPADAVVVPAHTSETISVSLDGSRSAPVTDRASLTAISAAAARNGVHASGVAPWHLKLTFEEFDRDGKQVDTGSFEESWAGDKEDVQVFSSDLLKHTDYSTQSGLFRLGDQRWPSKMELQIRSLVVAPFAEVSPAKNFSFRTEKQTFGARELDCKVVAAGFGDWSKPKEYCFLPGSDALRYRQGPSWDQVTYNDLFDFGSSHVARSILLTDGGVPRLRIKVVALEVLQATTAAFIPPSSATKLGDDILTGVQMQPIHTVPPEWPRSAQGREFTVVVELVVGLDGNVESAKAVSGPQEFYKAAEDVASKWTFKPYLVQDKPAKVRTRIQLSQM